MNEPITTPHKRQLRGSGDRLHAHNQMERLLHLADELENDALKLAMDLAHEDRLRARIAQHRSDALDFAASIAAYDRSHYGPLGPGEIDSGIKL